MYFDSCTNLNELKETYKKLAMKNHPDTGGDVETMKQINIEYDKIFAVLKELQNAEAERPESSTRKTTETPEEFIAIVDALLRIPNIEIELCGAWLWISGDTYPSRDDLKKAGCMFSGSKKKWYWRHPEDEARHSRGCKTMAQIRNKYGSELLGRADTREALPA